ncbi:MAG: lytic murein transglycosylase B [Methylotetracoccus sp.]
MITLPSIRLATALVATLLLVGCATKPADDGTKAKAQPIPAEPVVRAPERVPAPAGGYSAAFVTGDYAAYPALDRFIERMVAEHDFPRDYLNGLFSQARRREWTIEYMNREAPTTKPKSGAWSRYRSKFLTEQHISRGAAFWRSHADDLRRVKEKFGVPPEYVMGIMGVETIYGANVGKDRVFDALTTLAFDYPRRAAYFTDELESFLLMTRAERVDPLRPVGSFAGAMGLGQFMPSSFLKWAVDFDGDGRKDLWQAADAIGSVANYFVQHGWQTGESVVSPAIAEDGRASDLESGFDTQYSLARLADSGVRPAGPFSGREPVRLLRLSTNDGDEYWLGYQNFYVITRYNHSTHYAMAVHELAQAVKDRYLNGFGAPP